jgi:hypothetical protein
MKNVRHPELFCKKGCKGFILVLFPYFRLSLVLDNEAKEFGQRTLSLEVKNVVRKNVLSATWNLEEATGSGSAFSHILVRCADRKSCSRGVYPPTPDSKKLELLVNLGRDKGLQELRAGVDDLWT